MSVRIDSPFVCCGPQVVRLWCTNGEPGRGAHVTLPDNNHHQQAGNVAPGGDHALAAASLEIASGTGGISATPSRKVTVFPEIAGTRSPGTRIPTRFSGSAAEIVMTSLAGGTFRIARTDST